MDHQLVKHQPSIEETRQCLLNSLRETGRDLSFITLELLERPPFDLIRAIIQLFVCHLGFAQGLYNDNELILDIGLSRKEKIIVLQKILGIVSVLFNERFDLYLSPSRLLAGKDSLLTHQFLCTLCKASTVTPGQSKEAVEKPLQDGEVTAMYRAAVRTRNGIAKFQATFRGGRERQHSGATLSHQGTEPCSEIKPNEDTSAQQSQADIAKDDEIEVTHYVDLDGKIKSHTSTIPKKTSAGPCISDSSTTNVRAKTPQHCQNERTIAESLPGKKESLAKPSKLAIPHRTTSATKRRNRRATSDAGTSVELDNLEDARDMAELHVQKLQHRAAVEKFTKMEMNLRTRLQKTKEKEEALNKRESDLIEREQRVSRLADKIRSRKQREDALALKSNSSTEGKALAKASHTTTKNENTVAKTEIKSLKKKLFRSDRKLRRREDQVRVLAKRVRAIKMKQHPPGEIEWNSSVSSVGPLQSATTTTTTTSTPAIPTTRRRPMSSNSSAGGSTDSRVSQQSIVGASKPKVRSKTTKAEATEQSSKQPKCSSEGEKENRRATPPASNPATSTKSHCGGSPVHQDTCANTSKSVTFHSDVKVVKESAAPTRSRRVAYMESCTPSIEVTIKPLSSDKIRLEHQNSVNDSL